MKEKIIDTIKRGVRGIKKIDINNGNEIYVWISSEDVSSICEFVYENIDCSLVSLFATDEIALNGHFFVYYSFSVKKAGCLVVIKASIPSDEAKINSVAAIIPAASLYEREISDMFGIHFENSPYDRELVFHQNWPEGNHPLRKDFNASQKPAWADRKQKFVDVSGTGVFEIPVGPVHAGIIEPGHFRFSVAGEPIINLEAKLYYVHKGIEKLSENNSFEKVFFIAERISGDETVSNSLAYSLAVEKLAGISGQIPERADYTRSILCELERIYNHLGDISGICIDVAFGFAAQQFGMMRRWCMINNEEITGSRMLRSSIRPGGVRKDLIKGKEKSLLTHLLKLEKEFNDSVDIIKSSSLFIDRVENTGVLKLETAAELNAVGPGGRAAGIDGDVRRDFPYAAYDRLNFIVPVHNNGDVNCRMNVKIQELKESINIIRQSLEIMPSDGEVCLPVKGFEPYSYAFGMTESPRGENCHWVMSGENNTIFRYKIRTPSFCNWPVLCHAVKGNIVPDFPLINKSFNLSYSGNDL